MRPSPLILPTCTVRAASPAAVIPARHTLGSQLPPAQHQRSASSPSPARLPCCVPHVTGSVSNTQLYRSAFQRKKKEYRISFKGAKACWELFIYGQCVNISVLCCSLEVWTVAASGCCGCFQCIYGQKRNFCWTEWEMSQSCACIPLYEHEHG